MRSARQAPSVTLPSLSWQLWFKPPDSIGRLGGPGGGAGLMRARPTEAFTAFDLGKARPCGGVQDRHPWLRRAESAGGKPAVAVPVARCRPLATTGDGASA